MITEIFSDSKLDRAIHGYIKMFKIIAAIITVIALIFALIQKDIYVLFTVLFILGVGLAVTLFSIPITWYIYRLTTLSFNENKYKLLIWSIIGYGLINIVIVFQSIDFNFLLLILSPIIGAIGWTFAWIGGFIAIHVWLWFDKIIKRDYFVVKLSERGFNIINSILLILFAFCAIYAIYDQLIAN